MRILMIAIVLATTSASLSATDPDKSNAERGARPALTDGRFELEMTQMQKVPTSFDGRFKLDSGFDPEAAREVSDGRYALSSELRSKSAMGACNMQPELIFADGFE